MIVIRIVPDVLPTALQQLKTRLEACYGPACIIVPGEEACVLSINKIWSDQDEMLFQSFLEQRLIKQWLLVYPKEVAPITFTVPQEFGRIDVEKALRWIKKKLSTCAYPDREIGGMHAYRILQLIHCRLTEATGQPEMKQPGLPFI